MVREETDVFAAIAQRRDLNLDGVQPKKQIRTEAAGSCFGIYIRVRGGKDAHIYAAGGRGTDTLKFAGLQHAKQFGLQIQRDVCDFVQK